MNRAGGHVRTQRDGTGRDRGVMRAPAMVALASPTVGDFAAMLLRRYARMSDRHGERRPSVSASADDSRARVRARMLSAS